MPRQKKVKLIGLGLPANLLKEFIQLSYKGNTSISPSNYEIDAPLSDSRVKVYKKIGSNEVIITHRGSVGAQDWIDNAKFFVAGKVKGTKSFNLHKERQLKAVEKYGKDNNIIGLGHSRAGLYLQELQKDPETKLDEIVTYNKAVGFYDALRTNPDEQTDVKVKNDFVSLLSGLQKRKNKMVEIEATKNPLDFNKAHQAEEIEKLGETFIGKKDEEPMSGSGRAPSPKTLEQLNKMLKTLEGKLAKINKGKVYKTTNKEKVEYELSYTKARIKNHETKGEDLIITKKAKYGNELPAKAKAYKAKPKKEPKEVKPKEVKPEPKKEEPKKEEPKPEPKKEEPKKEEPITNPKLAKIEEFINDTENYLNKKSTRAFNAFMKKYDDKKFIKSVISAQMFSDFYPTAQKCLSNYKPYINNITEDDIILEPTAGLGSIVLWLLKNNVKSKILATDYDPNINSYLKESFAGINQVSILDHAKSNYLDMQNNFYKYNPSVIFLNPPFSNKGDKKYYLNFLFKALYDLKESEHPWREHQLFFISPQLTNKKEKNDQTIDFEDIVMSANKKKEIKKMLNINNEDEWEDIMPNQIVKVASCKDFGGTNVEAALYRIITYGNPSQKEEPKKEEPKKEEPKKEEPKKEEPKPFMLDYKEIKEEPKPKEVKAKEVKTEIKEQPKKTPPELIKKFEDIIMNKGAPRIIETLRAMGINAALPHDEARKYMVETLKKLSASKAKNKIPFTIEDFLTLYSNYSKNNCSDLMCEYNINSKTDYKKWIVKNHPDKGGTIDDADFKQILICAKKEEYCGKEEIDDPKEKEVELTAKSILKALDEFRALKASKNDSGYVSDYVITEEFRRIIKTTKDIDVLTKLYGELKSIENSLKAAHEKSKKKEDYSKYNTLSLYTSYLKGWILKIEGDLEKEQLKKEMAEKKKQAKAKAKKEGGIFGWSDKEKADKAERKMLREEYYKTHDKQQNANYTFDKTARSKWKREFYKKNSFKKADETMPKAVDTIEQQGIDEAEQEMLGSGMYYLKEISNPTNPIFKYKRTFEIPTFIDPETEFLMGGGFTDIAGMNCDKTTGKCFNPVYEKEKIRRQILSEYKIWYNPFAPPAAGTIRMAWLNPMIEERFKPIYDEFVARRNVNIGLPADASRDRFAQQMFSNLTDGLSYIPGSNLATAGLTLASTLSDTKKEDGT